MDGLTLIEGDVMDIAARLKEIDPRYELYRNLTRHRFEIHADGALQIAVPFARLDARTLDLVRETDTARADELLSRLDGNNNKLLKESEAALKERAARLVEEAL